MVSPQYSGPIQAGTTSTSTSAAAIVSSSTPCRAVVLQSDPDNTTDILIGDAASQVIQLTPGQSISLRVDNLNKVWADAVSGTPDLRWIIEL